MSEGLRKPFSLTHSRPSPGARGRVGEVTRNDTPLLPMDSLYGRTPEKTVDPFTSMLSYRYVVALTSCVSTINHFLHRDAGQAGDAASRVVGLQDAYTVPLEK